MSKDNLMALELKEFTEFHAEVNGCATMASSPEPDLKSVKVPWPKGWEAEP